MSNGLIKKENNFLSDFNLGEMIIILGEQMFFKVFLEYFSEESLIRNYGGESGIRTHDPNLLR